MGKNNLIQFANLKCKPSKDASCLPEQDAALFKKMLEGYTTRRLGALRHQESSVNRDISVIYDFLNFTGKSPWYWKEEDFEKWCHQIGIMKKLAVATQRHYQGTIRGFLAYLADNIKFKNDVRSLYGVQITQICHSENCIPHIADRELCRERPAFSHDEITLLFSSYDEAIVEAASFGAKDFRPLQRDKTMFFTIYAAGLRASEALKLNVGSFQRNPTFPQFKNFGYISVWGKGSRGSGPKHRMVPVTHVELPSLLEWYIEYVRPHFLVNGDPNEEALFLSERGTRLVLSSLENRFQHILTIASSLSGRGFTPHCLRHSSVTHESLRNISIEANRLKHGHTYAATTQGYTHIPDDFVNEEINRVISSQIDTMMEDQDNE